MNTICPNCSLSVSAANHCCVACGTLVNAPKIQCLKCRQQVDANSSFCVHCGASFNFDEPATVISPRFQFQSNALPQTTAPETSQNGFLILGVAGGVLLVLVFVVMIFSGSSGARNSASASAPSSSVPSSGYTFAPNSTSPASSIGREGRLTTNLNLRSAPNKTAVSVGIHFQNAKVKVLAVESYDTSEGYSVWYKVRILEYGCDAEGKLGCGKNNPNDSDEGWMNGKYISLN